MRSLSSRIMTVEVNMTLKQWSASANRIFSSHFNVTVGHSNYFLFQNWFHLKACSSNAPANLTWLLVSLSATEGRLLCALLAQQWVQPQRPDAHLLLDFFQPTVIVVASSGLQLKLNVQFVCSSTKTLVNLEYEQKSAELQHLLSLKGTEHLHLKMTNIKGYSSHLR